MIVRFVLCDSANRTATGKALPDRWQGDPGDPAQGPFEGRGEVARSGELRTVRRGLGIVWHATALLIVPSELTIGRDSVAPGCSGRRRQTNAARLLVIPSQRWPRRGSTTAARPPIVARLQRYPLNHGWPHPRLVGFRGITGRLAPCRYNGVVRQLGIGRAAFPAERRLRRLEIRGWPSVFPSRPTGNGFRWQGMNASGFHLTCSGAAQAAR